MKQRRDSLSGTQFKSGLLEVEDEVSDLLGSRWMDGRTDQRPPLLPSSCPPASSPDPAPCTVEQGRSPSGEPTWRSGKRSQGVSPQCRRRVNESQMTHTSLAETKPHPVLTLPKPSPLRYLGGPGQGEASFPPPSLGDKMVPVLPRASPCAHSHTLLMRTASATPKSWPAHRHCGQGSVECPYYKKKSVCVAEQN